MIIIIIQDLHCTNSLHSTLQSNGSQYGYNTLKYKRVKSALLIKAYNLLRVILTKKMIYICVLGQ